MNSTLKTLALMFAAAAISLLIGCAESEHEAAHDESAHDHASHSVAAVNDTSWVCPMEDTAPAQSPGECPKCGMNLHARVTDAEGNDVTPDATVYTCPMHPRVSEKQPGTCPECGMYLTLASAEMAGEHGHESSFACPMHPTVTSSEAGTCPTCGMSLVRGDASSEGEHGHE